MEDKDSMTGTDGKTEDVKTSLVAHGESQRGTERDSEWERGTVRPAQTGREGQ